jgi:hypothetical protein
MGLGSFGVSRLGMRDGRPLAAETDLPASRESRLKAGCSQDWLLHKSECISTNTNLLRGLEGVSLS